MRKEKWKNDDRNGSRAEPGKTDREANGLHGRILSDL